MVSQQGSSVYRRGNISLTFLRYVTLIKTSKPGLGAPSLQFLTRFANKLIAVALRHELPTSLQLQVLQIPGAIPSASLLWKPGSAPLGKNSLVKARPFWGQQKGGWGKTTRNILFSFYFNFSTSSPIHQCWRGQRGTKTCKTTSIAIFQILVHMLHGWEISWWKIHLSKTTVLWEGIS